MKFAEESIKPFIIVQVSMYISCESKIHGSSSLGE